MEKNEEVMKMVNYKSVAKTVGKVGDDAMVVGGLAISVFTPLMLGDGQKYLEKKTGIPAIGQTILSGFWLLDP